MFEGLKFFFLRKEIETCNEEFFDSFFLYSVFKIYILLVKKRESNVLLFFIYAVIERENEERSRYIPFLFYPCK